MSTEPTAYCTRRDQGFTLIEMLLAITMVGLVSVVIATTITVSLRNLPSTQDRADSAVLVQGLTTFLPPDVDSAEPGQFNTTATTISGCPGPSPGDNMLRLAWAERYRGVTTNFIANYRFIIEGDAGRIIRLTCSGTSTLSTPAAQKMSGPLATTAPVVVVKDYDPLDADTATDYVELKVFTLAGETIRINAASKNPNDELPYPLAPAAPPNAAPWAVAYNAEIGLGVPQTYALPVGDEDNPVLTASVANVPSQLSVTVGTNGRAITVTANPLTGALLGATYTFDYAVTDGLATASSTITLTVVALPSAPPPPPPPPCQIGAASLSPSGPVKLAPNRSGRLKNDVTVNVTVLGGYCVGLHLAYNNGAQVKNLGNQAPYTATIYGHPNGTELWTAGNHVLNIQDGADNVLAQITLVVTN